MMHQAVIVEREQMVICILQVIPKTLVLHLFKIYL